MLSGHRTRELREHCRCRVLTSDEVSDGGWVNDQSGKGALCGELSVTVTLREFPLHLHGGPKAFLRPVRELPGIQVEFICPQLPKPGIEPANISAFEEQRPRTF